MLDDHRTFLSCILCGRSPPHCELTEEHVFGRRIAADIGLDKRWVYAREGYVHQGSTALLRYAPKLLCKECNGAAMSPHMERVRPTITNLVTEGDVITAGEINDFLTYWQRIAIIWDIISSNHEMTEEYKQSPMGLRNQGVRDSTPLLSADQRLEWLRGSRDLPIRVFAAKHNGALGLDGYIAKIAYDYGSGDAPITRVHTLSMCYVIKKLAVYIILGEQKGHKILNHFREVRSQENVELDAADYADILVMDTRQGTPLIIQGMANPEVRRIVEFVSEKFGEFFFPFGLKELLDEHGQLSVMTYRQGVVRAVNSEGEEVRRWRCVLRPPPPQPVQ